MTRIVAKSTDAVFRRRRCNAAGHRGDEGGLGRAQSRWDSCWVPRARNIPSPTKEAPSRARMQVWARGLGDVEPRGVGQAHRERQGRCRIPPARRRRARPNRTVMKAIDAGIITNSATKVSRPWRSTFMDQVCASDALCRADEEIQGVLWNVFQPFSSARTGNAANSWRGLKTAR